ncbi:MAG: hypothetical protein R3D67_05365 [Hyphomicrobiaceae bacterium]
MAHEFALAITKIDEANNEQGCLRTGADDCGLDVKRDIETLKRQRQLKRNLAAGFGQGAWKALDLKATEAPIDRFDAMALKLHIHWGVDAVVPPLIWPLPPDFYRHPPLPENFRTWAQARVLLTQSPVSHVEVNNSIPHSSQLTKMYSVMAKNGATMLCCLNPAYGRCRPLGLAGAKGVNYG